MNVKKMIIAIATLGPIGYMPCAGTVATFVTMLFMLCLWYVGYTSSIIAQWVLPVIGLSGIVIQYVVRFFDDADPSEIVLDEVSGYMLAMALFPLKPLWLVSVALIFRFFDILKPFGIRYFERVCGVAGVLLDDLVAALYTQITIIFVLVVNELCCNIFLLKL
jgi:phosphatidylglycerophosphatase A